MNKLRKKFVGMALTKLGAPYIWGGHGYKLWTPTGLIDTNWTTQVFDCAGLVTSCLKEAGGPDWRLTCNAQLLHNECEETGRLIPSATPPDEPNLGWLAFYGRSPGEVSHVAIHIAGGMVLEASGGDSRTTTLTAAANSGAKVRIGWNGRQDLIGYGIPKELQDE